MSPDDILRMSKSGYDYNSFVTIYPNGGNRITSVRGLNLSSNPPDRVDNTTYQFGLKARRRFYDYCMSLNLEGFTVYFCTFTLPQNDIPYYIVTLSRYRTLMKRFNQSINREGYDIVSKTEFHRENSRAEVWPHVHAIIVSDGNEDLQAVRSRFCDIWMRCVLLYLIDSERTGIELSLFAWEKMRAVCTQVQLIRDPKKAIHYLAAYTAKKKKEARKAADFGIRISVDYQNILPEKFVGLRFTNKGISNFRDRLFAIPVQKIRISDNMFHALYAEFQRRSVKQRGKVSFIQNGFYLDGLDPILCNCDDLHFYDLACGHLRRVEDERDRSKLSHENNFCH